MKESFFKRAKENLLAAEMLFEQELYNASANRAYYAAFHAAIVAIYSVGIDPKIDHKAVQSLFSDYYFNRRKVLSSKYKEYLIELMYYRSLADYKSGISKKDAKNQLNKSQELVEIILEVIK